MTSTAIIDYLRQSNPRAALLRLECDDAARYANQRRHDLRLGALPAYVNPSPLRPNMILIEPFETALVKQLAKERRAKRETQRAMKSNAGIAVRGLIGFGIEAQVFFEQLSDDEKAHTLRKVVAGVSEALATTPSGLVVHFDETAVHAHFSLIGYDMDGRPLSQRLGRGLLSQMQTLLHDTLLPVLPMLERGRAKQVRSAAGARDYELIHRSVDELHRDLPGEIAGRRAELAAVQAHLEAEKHRLALARKRAEQEAEVLRKARESAEAEVVRLAAAAKALSEKLAARQDFLGRQHTQKQALEQQLADMQHAIGALEGRAATAKTVIERKDDLVRAMTACVVRASVAVIKDELQHDGKEWTFPDVMDTPLKQVKQHFGLFQPAVHAVARFWSKVRDEVDALPEDKRQALLDRFEP